jgi:hypothetical protein
MGKDVGPAKVIGRLKPAGNGPAAPRIKYITYQYRIRITLSTGLFV